jgi:hypothetical protein
LSNYIENAIEQLSKTSLEAQSLNDLARDLLQVYIDGFQGCLAGSYYEPF